MIFIAVIYSLFSYLFPTALSSQFLYCFVSGCYSYDLESHNAVNTRQFFESKLADYKLEFNHSVYVVSDNEAKMLAAFKLNCKRLGCSVRYIN